MAIAANEYLKGAEVPDKYKDNFDTLLKKINIFAERIDDYFGRHITLIVTSGIRTEERQIQIYKEKAKKNQYPFTNGVFDINKVPMGSAHISCEGIDIYDPEKLIADYVLDTEILEELDLYCEDPNYTSNWLHLQTRAPRSGQRFFKP